jgi:uncharacterized protein (DUF1015 family)
MPRFEPFAAWRPAPGLPLDEILAPPYDVLSDADVDRLQRHRRNITFVDVPRGGADRYDQAAVLLRGWLADGTLVADDQPSLTIYRMSFRDASGRPRVVSGVFGGLAVVDQTASGVLPHERVTPKASTDRLDLTRATGCNLSAVWGLSLAQGLTDELAEPGEPWGGLVCGPDGMPVASPGPATGGTADHEEIDGRCVSPGPATGGAATAAPTSPELAPGEPVTATDASAIAASLPPGAVYHAVERLTDPARIARIVALIGSDDVLIADGHHRYGVARAYRDEVRAATGRTDTAAELTLAFVNELRADQLSIEAIHRLYAGLDPARLRARLAESFDLSPAPAPTPQTLAEMVSQGRLVLLQADGAAEWLTPKASAFDGVRALDGAYLEHALAGLDYTVTYQHGLAETLAEVATGRYAAGVLIRPTALPEILRTAREGLLMPPKSTFFTPKLLTGWVIRPIRPTA